MKSFLYVVGGLLLFFAALLGSLTLLNRLTSQPSVVLTNTCDPACWNGIQVGETTRWEAVSILEQDHTVDEGSINFEMKRNSPEITKIYWRFKRPARDSMGSIDLEQDRVKAITIYSIGSLTVSDAFNKLGQPEKMWTHIGRGEAREFLEITLLYPAQGYAVEMNIDLEGKSDHVEIFDNTPVFRITYFDPNQFQQLLETQILIREPVISRKENLQHWTGLGSIYFKRR